MKRLISILILLIFAINFVCASEIPLSETSDYINELIPSPSAGDEWAVVGLIRGGAENGVVKAESYYTSLCDYLTSRGGVLHRAKNTEYSRAVLALTAIGKNPSDVGGYNLLAPLADFDKTTAQGINGAIWALIALDCGSWDLPSTPNGATRDMYKEYILSKQCSDGGWSLSSDSGDVDMTAMALIALSKYRDEEETATASERAIAFLEKAQNENGSFTSLGEENSESSAQVILALCELDIPINDPRFVKNGKSALDALLSYRTSDGGFLHTKSDLKSNPMSSVQALCALTSLGRKADGKSALFDMTESESAKNPLHPLHKIYFLFGFNLIAIDLSSGGY